MTKYHSNKEHQAIHAAIAELIEKSRLYRSCLTCEHFDEATELCLLNGANQRPPARVIAMGCSAYFELPPF
jgi:hypothetical protein